MKRIASALILFLAFTSSLFASGWFIQESGSVNIDLSAGLGGNQETILIASFEVRVDDADDDPRLKLNFDNQDWHFSSASNPGYSIPYGLEVDVLDTDGSKVIWQAYGYDKDGNEAKATYLNEINKSFVHQDGDHFTVQFRLILHTSYAGVTTALAADDYISSFSITFTDGSIENSYDVRMGGYYNTSATADSVLLSIIPNSNARLLNISEMVETGSTVSVGNWEFTSISTEEKNTSSSPYRIYASSSSTYNDSGTTFALTNTKDSNSKLPFTVYIGNTDFDGKFSTSMSMISTEIRSEATNENTYILTCHGSGEIGIKIDSVPSNLAAGYYEADIYFHVVSTK